MRRLLVLGLALAACDRGFGLQLDVKARCLPDAAQVEIDVVAYPSERAQVVTVPASRFASDGRVMIVPPTGTTNVVVELIAKVGVTAVSDQKLMVKVDHPELAEREVDLDACAAVDAGAPDEPAPQPDLTAPPDLVVRCTDTSCGGATPACDPVSGRCVACVKDDQCAPGTTCAANQCVPGCNASYGCGDAGACVDGGRCHFCAGNGDCPDPTYRFCDVKSGACVQCLADGDCPNNQSCKLGLCKPKCTVDGDCAKGQSCCGVCVDEQTDVNNCGACGKACVVANATAACKAGACAVGVCNPGYGDCDGLPGDGCEANLATDVKNCLGCGKSCVAANAAQLACKGGCSIVACNAGFGDCDQQEANGCEATLGTDPANCGVCGMHCLQYANTTAASCAGGSCALGPCAPGFRDCDKAIADGCEVDVNGDPNNCGKCGGVCGPYANASPACANGACALTCNPGFADCNQSLADGCEVNVAGDANNCGLCGHVCGANLNCVNGNCSMCQPPLLDCGQGCVVHSDSDPNNCGGCGAVCSNAHDTPQCTNGVCTSPCNAGFANCDGTLRQNGCNVNINQNVNNCGGCGMGCSGVNDTKQCTNGVCTSPCNAGWANCDGTLRQNGCNVNINQNVNNCGACGKVCGPQANTSSVICNGGACAVNSCVAPWADCDGQYADGCEADTSSDPANCGFCTRLCADQCVNGNCTSPPDMSGGGTDGGATDDGSAPDLAGGWCPQLCTDLVYNDLKNGRQWTYQIASTFICGGKMMPVSTLDGACVDINGLCVSLGYIGATNPNQQCDKLGYFRGQDINMQFCVGSCGMPSFNNTSPPLPCAGGVKSPTGVTFLCSK